MLKGNVNRIKLFEPVPNVLNVFCCAARTHQAKRVRLQSEANNPDRFDIANEFVFFILRDVYHINNQLV